MDIANVYNLIIKARNGDQTSRNDLIKSNRGFIRRVSSHICKRSLDWSNDDELSIALIAFNEAIDNFDPDKGAEFLTYSKVLIHNRLIDYFRKSKIHIPISILNNEEQSSIENREAMDKYSILNTSEERAMEIKMFDQELLKYNLSMEALTRNSPKHRDTRKILFEIALKCGNNSNIISTLRQSKMLPIKSIMELTGAKRKFIEKWRKYLIALITITSSDEYLYLKEYINFNDDKVVEQ